MCVIHLLLLLWPTTVDAILSYPEVIFGAILGYSLVQNWGTLVMFLVKFVMHFLHYALLSSYQLELEIVHYCFA